MSNENKSPWLSGINRDIDIQILSESQKTDLCIIGGGISGVMTAYFTLKYTDKKVIVLEGNKIAHGSTGHNAGQIASYFERPFSSIVEEYGLNLAIEAQKDILSAWDLLNEICLDLEISTPIVDFIGYAGISSIDDINHHLYNNFLRMQGGIEPPIKAMISNKVNKSLIKSDFLNLCVFVAEAEINEKLEVRDNNYIALFSAKKGLVNSAALVIEIASKIRKKYLDRIKIYEHSRVEKIIIKKDSAEATCWGFKVHSKDVVLCTNGFEGIKLIDDQGTNLDHKLNENVRRVVGYMAGYTDETKKNPTAISYFPENMKNYSINERTYFYLTRRNFKIDENHQSLICIGGPEIDLHLSNIYIRDHDYSNQAKEDIDNFVKKEYNSNLKDTNLIFNWFGLMGYTKSGLRVIGRDNSENVLMYNIGCNGVGILSSIYGGYKIASILSGKKFPKSVFDYL